MGVGGDTDERLEIGNDITEVGDQRPLPVAVPMAHVVLGVHGDSERGESFGDVGVAGAVFGVAVNEHDDSGRLTVREPLLVVDRAARSVEGRHGSEPQFAG